MRTKGQIKYSQAPMHARTACVNFGSSHCISASHSCRCMSTFRFVNTSGSTWLDTETVDCCIWHLRHHIADNAEQSLSPSLATILGRAPLHVTDKGSRLHNCLTSYGMFATGLVGVGGKCFRSNCTVFIFELLEFFYMNTNIQIRATIQLNKNTNQIFSTAVKN